MVPALGPPVPKNDQIVLSFATLSPREQTGSASHMPFISSAGRRLGS